MPPKKKGKGSKLSRMTEEERARYLQHRAAIEEEARRRKQQLIANFMKNKLKHEEAFTRLNLAKINQQWRHILRQIKTKELKEELEYVWHLFEHITDGKNRIIETLLNDLQDSEEQYAKNLRSHAETIDQLIELHSKRVEELHSRYKFDRTQLHEKTSKEYLKMKSVAINDEETLKTVNYQMQCDMEKWISKWQNGHIMKTDEVRNEMLSNIDTLQTEKESNLQHLWKEFQTVLQEYTNSTENQRNQYSKLKARDEIATDAIAKHTKIIDSLCDSITSLKQQVLSLKSTEQEKIDDLKRERAYYLKLFSSFRKKLVYTKRHDENQLKVMATASNEALKEIFDYMKMDNFWKRYNRVYLERAALSLHREALIMENHQLTRALQQYLATLAKGAEQPLPQPSLTVARPISSHIIREHINLIPGEEDVKERHKRMDRPRTVTCIEANHSIAVRHLLRSRVL
ncbi:hypothetical protein C0J52_20851 [Blattella germanica]|nr:hypothetical protein C0J52_20851 [Blattella germanica]